MKRKMGVIFLAFLITALAAAGHIFDDLSETELQEVIDYLQAQPDLGLSPQGSPPDLRSSFVRMVEALNVPKAKALRHLDQGGPAPEKRATAILFRGDLEVPVVEEYVIWPIPSPQHHKVINNPKWRSPIPFSARSPLNSVSLELIPRRMAREFAKVDHILEKTTGYRYNNCSDKCLEMAPAGPAQTVSGKHIFMGYLIRQLEGKYLLPVGLQFVLDMEDLDAEKWKVLKVWWQGHLFSSFDELRQKFDEGKLKYKNVHQPEDAFGETLSSSLNHRGTPLPEAPQRGPKSYVPDGDRVHVDGRQVAWQAWQFNFNVRSSTGIQLHDVRFNKERIVYELSLQELAVFYSGGEPVSRHTAFYDSDAMLGYSGTELFKGVDCPVEAHFFDAVHYHKDKPLVFRNTICVFEWNRGIPLRRHYASNYEGGYKYFHGMPDNVLIVRTIPTIDNYDYIVDIMLHQDGKIEVKTSLTGYLITTFYQDPSADDYGYEVINDVIGNLHLHSANFRVDMDIAGTKNRVSTLDISLEDVPDTLNPGVTLKNRKFTKNLRRTEREAAYRYNFDTPKYIVFSNVNSTNKFGNPRGYRLDIASPAKMLWPDDYRGNKAWAWTKYQMAVTLYNENEQRSSSLYNFEEPFDPIFSLDDYINDDQTIVDKDLVTWVTVGAHHIPHSEDVPIVTTPSVQLTFFLLPYNFFDEDPSLASRDNVRVEPGESGDYIVTHAGVPAEEYCARKDVTCRGVIDKTSGATTVDFVGSLIATVLALVGTMLIL